MFYMFLFFFLHPVDKVLWNCNCNYCVSAWSHDQRFSHVFSQTVSTELDHGLHWLTRLSSMVLYCGYSQALKGISLVMWPIGDWSLCCYGKVKRSRVFVQKDGERMESLVRPLDPQLNFLPLVQSQRLSWGLVSLRSLCDFLCSSVITSFIILFNHKRCCPFDPYRVSSHW